MLWQFAKSAAWGKDISPGHNRYLFSVSTENTSVDKDIDLRHTLYKYWYVSYSPMKKTYFSWQIAMFISKDLYLRQTWWCSPKTLPSYSGGWGRGSKVKMFLSQLSKFKVSLDIFTALCLQNKSIGAGEMVLSVKHLSGNPQRPEFDTQNLCKIRRGWFHTSVISAWVRQGQVDLWGSPASVAYLGTSRLIWDPVLKKKWAVHKENHLRHSSDLHARVYLNTRKTVYAHTPKQER